MRRTVLNDCSQLSSASPTLFHRTACVTARRESTHDCIVPRYIQALAHLRVEALEPTAVSLRFEDIDAALVGKFLDDLEKARASTAKTRNTRLAALRSFFRFV